MNQWSYRVENIPLNGVAEVLDSLGKDGWEVIGFHLVPGKTSPLANAVVPLMMVVFKRPVHATNCLGECR